MMGEKKTTWQIKHGISSKPLAIEKALLDANIIRNIIYSKNYILDKYITLIYTVI